MPDEKKIETPVDKKPPPPPGKLRVSIIAQLEPIGRYQNPDGDALAGSNLERYAAQLTEYLGKNLSRFSDPRGGDVFLQVFVQHGDQSEGNEFRSGHYVKEEKADEPAKPAE